MNRHATIGGRFGFALVLAACGGLLAACGGEAATQPTAGPTTPVATEPVATQPATTEPAEPVATEPVATQPATTEPAEPVATDLADGRHATYLRGIDVQARTLTVDVIQFLTGAEAEEAYHRDHPEDPHGPPNDYYILNVNPRLRTLDVTAGVQVALVRLQEGLGADLKPGTWQELPGYLAAYEPADDDRLSYNPFWITMSGGRVTAIEEQYIP